MSQITNLKAKELEENVLMWDMEKTGDFSEIELDVSANKYVVEKLKGGLKFSEEASLLKLLMEGRCFTIVSKDYDERQVYDFNHGGLLPLNGKIDFLLISEIERFLSSPDKVVVIEDILAKPDDIAIRKREELDQSMKVYGNQVFYVINADSKKNVTSCFIKSNNSWQFVILFFEVDVLKNNSFLSLNDIAHQIDSLEFIAVNAYDGESYVFWERNAKPITK